MNTKMPISGEETVIVSYRQMARAFRPESVRSMEESLEAVSPREELSRASMLAQVSHAMQELELAEEHGGIMVAVPDRAASLLQTFLADRSMKIQKFEPVDTGGLEAKFDEHDIGGWIGSFFTWWKRLRPHRLLKAPDEPERLPNTARVALFSDWGTGLYGAPKISESIRNDPERYQLVLHLGDVYYSGDDDEIRKRLLAAWPRVTGAINRALNANHEMYTGGKAYFKIALKDFNQKASYFAFQNDHWTLVGLDSAHKDHDLAGNQVTWLEGLLRKSDGRKTVLFSHHQPFSLFDRQGPKLVEKLGRLLDEEKIFAWYWGHEHRCLLYDRHPAWNLYGRCIGHGGYPYFRNKLGPVPPSVEWKELPGKNFVPGGIILDGPNPYIKGHEKEYGPHGYLSLKFEDGNLHEIVHDADGSILHEQTLRA